MKGVIVRLARVLLHGLPEGRSDHGATFYFTLPNREGARHT